MADIQPFRALRYDLSVIGSLAEVVAPPYDVIDPELQNDLYHRHPANVVRLILNRAELGDEPDENYRRAGRFLRLWQKQGVLRRDGQNAVYVYHQQFQHEGHSVTRRGFLCRVRLEPFGEGRIYAHEQTHAGPREDRLKLMQSCHANLSPIFGLFADKENQVQARLEAAIEDRTPIQAEDHLGVTHRMWQVTDSSAIARVTTQMGDRPLVIADGHHRYETACAYREQLASEHPLPLDHPANYVLMMCVSLHDPGLVILPTHRMFRGLPPIDSQTLCERLGEDFDCRVSDYSAADTEAAWQVLQVNDDASTLGLFCAKDGRWVFATPSAKGMESLAQRAPDYSDQWRSLGVSVLHQLAMPSIIGDSSLPTPRYVHSVAEVVDGLEKGDPKGRDATGQSGTGEPYQLAALVLPATLKDVHDISLGGERMPAKSTYFFPKLLSGLVINSLD